MCSSCFHVSISDLRNVSFAYPGAKSNDNAIKNISLKIPAGHLVVIVGANGSGKSTLIKLLNRLYDVDSGEILVDGLPIANYRLADLRKAQALLAQDHTIYPINLAESIGLGNPNCMNDMKMVMEAAESGGASEVINKLTDGLQTTLDPVQTAHGHRLDKDKHKKLKSILEDLEKKAEVSGRRAVSFCTPTEKILPRRGKATSRSVSGLLCCSALHRQRHVQSPHLHAFLVGHHSVRRRGRAELCPGS